MFQLVQVYIYYTYKLMPSDCLWVVRTPTVFARYSTLLSTVIRHARSHASLQCAPGSFLHYMDLTSLSFFLL